MIQDTAADEAEVDRVFQDVHGTPAKEHPLGIEMLEGLRSGKRAKGSIMADLEDARHYKRQQKISQDLDGWRN